jgi:predicted transcriptional regulator
MKSEVITFAHDIETGKPIQTTVKKLIENRALWEGSSGSGKSHGMVTMIEQTDGLCQRIVIDLEGEYFPLKNDFSFLLIGKSTDKVEVDLELNTNDVHVEKLAQKLLLKSVDTIIDLSETDNATHFVSVFFDALFKFSKLMKRPLLIFLDESQEFAMERGMGKEESLKAVMKMAKRGRKHGIGLICGTQAIADFSKNVVRQLRTRMIGDCTYENDIKAAAESLGFSKERRKELSELAENHEFFVSGQGIMIDGKRPTKVLKIKAIQNKTKLYDFDFKSNVKIHEKNPKAMKELISEFADIPQIIDSELSEIELLRKDKIDLQVKLNTALKSVPTISSNQSHIVKIDPKLIQKAEEIGITKGFNQGITKTKLILQPYIDRIEKSYVILLDRYNKINSLSKDEFKDIKDIKEGLDLNVKLIPEVQLQSIPDRSTLTKKTTNGFHKAILDEKSTNDKNITMNDDQKVTGGALRMLKVCKHYGVISKNKMCLYSKLGPTNGTTTNYISELRVKGLIEDYEEGQFKITDLGNLIAGETDSVPKSSDIIVEMWTSKFTIKINEMMKTLVSIYPNSVSREELANKVGLQISGTFTNYMSDLRKNNILVNSGEGIKASDDLFPERV